MSNESRVALDVSLYRSSPLEEVSSDVASLNVEAASTNKDVDPNRIWWFNRLPQNLSTKKPDFDASLAALDLERHIQSTPDNRHRLVILVSPASNFPEGRLDLYFVKNQNGAVTFDAYGIPLRHESPQKTEARLNQFALISDTKNLPPLHNQDAAMTPLSVTSSSPTDLCKLAQRWIDLPDEVWGQINSGEIKNRCQKLTQDMIPVAIAIQADLAKDVSPHRVGAQAETQMVSISGQSMDFSGSGCGESNSVYVSTSASYDFHIGQEVFCIGCPLCCREIGTVLTFGHDPCPHCGKPFGPHVEKTISAPPAVTFTETFTQSSLTEITAFAWLSNWWSQLQMQPN